jgi:hypothetical protein
MRVTWFCFISHIFVEEKIPTETINVFVRLFLSSCRRFWILGERNHANQLTDGDTSSKKRTSGKKRQLNDGKSTTNLDDQKAKKKHTIQCE